MADRYGLMAFYPNFLIAAKMTFLYATLVYLYLATTAYPGILRLD